MFRPIAYELTRCPVCRSADTEQVAGADEIRGEVEELWAFHGRRLRPATPPERLLDRLAFSQAPPWRVVRCQGCTLLFRNPRERPSELEAAYKVDTPAPAVLAALFENQRRSYRTQARRLTDVLGRTGAGVEVGSYVGAFLAAAMDAGWHFEGLDISAETSAFARERGFAVSTGTLETFVTGRRFDAVAIWNCFEQLPDPRAAAVRARALLRPGGVLAIRTPNGAFWLRLRRWLRGPAAAAARALLAHNNLLALPYRHAFTVRALSHVLHDADFRIERIVGDVLVPIADEWTHRWAAIEERALKTMLRALRGSATPWLEVYARAE
ncbi:MAG TPA: methyltransferase domain-containing protein [Gemmatimonadaceae bacterium]|nr:methyltransferase domain-containing protein [Gemmatimonadaceae bacterium]